MLPVSSRVVRTLARRRQGGCRAAPLTGAERPPRCAGRRDPAPTGPGRLPAGRAATSPPPPSRPLRYSLRSVPRVPPGWPTASLDRSGAESARRDPVARGGRGAAPDQQAPRGGRHVRAGVDPLRRHDQRPRSQRGGRAAGAGPPGGPGARLPVRPVRRPRRLRLRRQARPDHHRDRAASTIPSPEEGTAMPDTHVTIVGNLTDDPEVTFTPNGAAVTNFRLAVTARIKDGDTWRDGDTS